MPKSYYNLGYSDGFSKADNAEVTYLYHYHDESCYSQCYVSMTYDGHSTTHPWMYSFNYTHNDCGAGSGRTYLGDHDGNKSYYHNYLSCGYTDGQLIGAEIIY